MLNWQTRKRERESIMDINMEKLLYVLGIFDDYICDLIYNVLNDSEEDPHYSAVAATNLIKSYIQIMTELGKKLPYNDVKSFFEDCAYTEDEYNAFEKSRLKESEYYRGKQF